VTSSRFTIDGGAEPCRWQLVSCQGVLGKSSVPSFGDSGQQFKQFGSGILPG